MKIKNIQVTNFRSLAKAEINASDFNIFVGQNNCGKTNLFEALEWFYKGTPKSIDLNRLRWQMNGANEIVVAVTFSGAQQGVKAMIHEGNKEKISAALGGADEITVVRKSSDDKKRECYVNGKPIKPGTGFDAALNDFLPRFEYIHTKQYYDAVAKYAKTTPVGVMLSGVLAAILEKNEEYQDFQEQFSSLFESGDSEIRKNFDFLGKEIQVNLAKQFPDTESVSFRVTIPEIDDLLKNFETTINDGVETSAEEKGDGMQRALMLAIIQTYAAFRRKDADAGKAFLFFIDEAELHLHPAAQRKLKDALLEIASNEDQVFINTHSAVFVADDHAKQSLYKIEKDENRASSVEAVSKVEKRYVIYELLGGSPSDLLLPQNFLVVEGPAEVEFFTGLVERLYPHEKSIQVVPARGDYMQVDRSIAAIEKIFTVLEKSLYGEKIVVLIDKPSPEAEGGVNQFLQERAALRDGNRFFRMPLGSIEECYPNHRDWRKTADQVSSMKGTVKVNLARRVGREITQEQLNADMAVARQALERCFSLSY